MLQNDDILILAFLLHFLAYILLYKGKFPLINYWLHGNRVHLRKRVYLWFFSLTFTSFKNNVTVPLAKVTNNLRGDPIKFLLAKSCHQIVHWVNYQSYYTNVLLVLIFIFYFSDNKRQSLGYCRAVNNETNISSFFRCQAPNVSSCLACNIHEWSGPGEGRGQQEGAGPLWGQQRLFSSGHHCPVESCVVRGWDSITRPSKQAGNLNFHMMPPDF